jgi:TfdA family taurine catabolism dioxygenase TauD
MNVGVPHGPDFLIHVRREDRDGELAELIARDRRSVSDLLNRFGVIIFKGYDIDAPEKLHRAAHAFSQNLLDYRERAAPRTEVRNKVYTSTEFPKEETIALHHEMSYSYNFPQYLFFCCAVPAESGGVTPVADDRVVVERIPKRIRDNFQARKIMYVRNFGTGLDMEWRTAFQTDSRAAVERYLTDSGTKFVWHTEKWLETRFVADPIIHHPLTGESVWFNHAHLFHSSNLPDRVRAPLIEAFTERGLPRNVFYGDGETIADDDLALIRELYSSHSMGESWEKGDFMLIDNLRAVHGRTPFRGSRKIYVCMSDLLLRTAVDGSSDITEASAPSADS